MKIKDVKLEYLGHAGFMLEWKGKKIVIDPFNVSDKVPKADFILITHGHPDHCSIKDVEKLADKGTIVVLPAGAQSKITKIDGVEMQIIEIGEELQIGGFKVEAVSAYNLNKNFHPKSEGWLGYLVKLNGTTIYHAGDSDKIPEMEKLTGYGKKGSNFIALLPVSGTYVMDADEAAEVADLLKPNLAVPMHYGSVVGTLEDAKRFCELCMRKNVRAEILEKV